MKLKTCSPLNVLVSNDGEFNEVEDELLQEEALQLRINRRDFTMTMRTPGADSYLVRGLLHSEGMNWLYSNYREEDTPNGTLVNIDLDCSTDAHSSKRRLASTSSCGLCGKKDLSSLFPEITPIQRGFVLMPSLITSCYSILKKRQELFSRTGCSHAAAAFTVKAELLCAFEDIGRHNAVDKVIGCLLEKEQLQDADLLVVSSRLSYEIVHKCARAGIPVLAGVSAPSSLAVNMAQKLGITMAAFCRGKRAAFYSNLHRLALAPQVQ